MLFNESQVDKIAHLINGLIDIPILGERFEFLIFKSAVTLVDKALEEVLPSEFVEIINNPELGFEVGNQSGEFIERLVYSVNKRVDIPMLNEKQEEKLIRTILELLVKSMAKGKQIDNLLSRITA